MVRFVLARRDIRDRARRRRRRGSRSRARGSARRARCPIAHVPTGWKKPRAVARTCSSAPTSAPGRSSRAAYGATSGEAASSRRRSKASASTSTSRSSRQEAVVDRQRRLGVGPVQPHRAVRARLHREGGAADLAARRRAPGRRTGRARPAGTSGSTRRPSPGPCRARARPRAPRSRRAAARSAPRRRRRRRGRPALRRPAAPLARARAAAQQDPRRAVGAAETTTVVGPQLAAAGERADRAGVLDQHAVDERVGEDRQVLRARERGRRRRSRRASARRRRC